MSDLIVYEHIEPPEIPIDWDFQEEDKNFDELIFAWRRLTPQILSKLWIFYNKLSKPGARNDLSPNGDRLPTWQEWLSLKGIGQNTPTRHFKLLGWLPQDALVTRFTGNQENYTPEQIIECVRGVLGTIDLDPASCDIAQRLIQAKKIYTQNDDGLNQPWGGNVFLNPPYQMPLIRQFTDKLINELPNIESAILLTNDQTDTLWFQKCARLAQVVCFTKGRISFYTENGIRTAPTNGQAFQYFGEKKGRFIEVFREIGLLLEPIHV